MPESSIIFLLRESINEVIHIIIILQEKVEILKKYFFSKELQSNLSNMKKTYYLLKVEQLLLIFTKVVIELIQIC